METKHKTKIKERYEKSGKKWIAEVENLAKGLEGEEIKITTEYNSENSDIENILHKVELDLYTNLEFGFELPIKVKIKEIKK